MKYSHPLMESLKEAIALNSWSYKALGLAAGKTQSRITHMFQGSSTLETFNAVLEALPTQILFDFIIIVFKSMGLIRHLEDFDQTQLPAPSSKLVATDKVVVNALGQALEKNGWTMQRLGLETGFSMQKLHRLSACQVTLETFLHCFDALAAPIKADYLLLLLMERGCLHKLKRFHATFKIQSPVWDEAAHPNGNRHLDTPMLEVWANIAFGAPVRSVNPLEGWFEIDHYPDAPRKYIIPSHVYSCEHFSSTC